MAFKKYSSRFWVLLIMLQASMICLAWFVIIQKWYITSGIMALLIIVQALVLLRFIKTTNRKLAQFLALTNANDHTLVFNQRKIGSGFDELHSILNTINEKLKNSRIDQESQFLLFKGMINKLETGILVLNNSGDILLTNPAFYKLLDLPEDNNWLRLQKRIPGIIKQINSLKDLQTEIISFQDQNKREKQLLAGKNQFIINSENYAFYSFRNIRKELEKKEVESWHRLIRVLTHEIMNSVSPIVSLSSTLQMILSHQTQSDGQHIMDPKNYKDLELSVKTIQNRGKGLMDFIDQYSKLTKIPQPKIEQFNIEASLKELKLLLADKTNELKIDFQLQFSKPDLIIKADKVLLEQVMLNLILNAFEACEDSENAAVCVSVQQSTSQLLLHIDDNGKGIDPEIEKDIFLPFFTTKNKGSGIGLSLSKNIIVAHGGDLYYSRKKKGSSFIIELPN